MTFSRALQSVIPGARNFFWNEALWLPGWHVHAIPTPEAERNIIEVAQRMERVREFFGVPIHITSWYRPLEYNRFIKGALRSRHLTGQACDFQVPSVSADDVRAALLPHLVDFNLCMEDLPGSSWTHIDIACPPGMTPAARFFKP